MSEIMTDIDRIKITKGNQLVEVKLLEVGNRLKLRDQKVILAVIGQISPDDEDFKDYRVTINELMALTGITDTPRPIGRGFLDRSKNLPASTRLP